MIEHAPSAPTPFVGPDIKEPELIEIDPEETREILYSYSSQNYDVL